MTDIKYLKNFPFETVKFVRKLKSNNNREWLEKNRTSYEELFLKPAQAFVEQMGFHLQDIDSDFNVIPKIDKSIFRLHRDVRFSKNKEPYKTNLGILFWVGEGKKMESSGLYFHVDSKKFFIATGMYMFTKEQIKKYREIVSVEKNGSELNSIMKKLIKKGYLFGGKTFKKVPRGYDKEYKFSDLLLYSGVYAYKENELKKLDNKEIIKYTLNIFKDLKPHHDWCIANLI